MERNILPVLDHSWLNAKMLRRWASHRNRSKGLPEELAMTFNEINAWLNDGLGNE